MKINEIYIDNYKCLSNFRIKPGEFQLWLGDNGSGKSTVFEVLQCVQDVLRGNKVDDVFSSNCLTAWDKRNTQWTQINCDHDGDRYTYQLTIEHCRKEHTRRIVGEVLTWNDKNLFFYDGNNVIVSQVDQQTGETKETFAMPSEGRRSAIPDIADREEFLPLICFRKAVLNLLLCNPIPHLMDDVAESEASTLSYNGDNFAKWYRYIIQEEPRIVHRANEHLEKVLPGLEQIKLKEIGSSRQLVVSFRIAGEMRDFAFRNLSDGQRQLIILYTVMEALRAGTISALFIDEPDNFVSLREIQPWLDCLQDICEEEDRQAIIISHHPEIINSMARGEELWFSREEGAHVVVKPLQVTQGGLTPAEIVSRGWEK